MLWKLLRETGELDPPTHIAVIFDLSEQDASATNLYDDYKANRPAPPDDLIPQFPLIREAVQAFNVACIEQRGLRGRRPDRHLCAPGARGRRAR